MLLSDHSILYKLSTKLYYLAHFQQTHNAIDMLHISLFNSYNNPMIRCHYYPHCIDENVTGPTSQLRSERVRICGSPDPESELNY